MTKGQEMNTNNKHKARAVVGFNNACHFMPQLRPPSAHQKDVLCRTFTIKEYRSLRTTFSYQVFIYIDSDGKTATTASHKTKNVMMVSTHI